MWVVVFVAASQEESERIRELLAREGLLASLRSAGVGGPVEVLVPEGEIEEAQEILAAHQGG